MGRDKVYLDKEKFEQYAALGLSRAEIADCMGMSVEWIHKQFAKDPEVPQLYKRARARTTAACAQTIIQNAVKTKDLKAALEWLRRNSEGWREPETAVKLNHQGEVKVDYQNVFTPEALTRVAKTYLQTRGESVD